MNKNVLIVLYGLIIIICCLIVISNFVNADSGYEFYNVHLNDVNAIVVCGYGVYGGNCYYENNTFYSENSIVINKIGINMGSSSCGLWTVIINDWKSNITSDSGISYYFPNVTVQGYFNVSISHLYYSECGVNSAGLEVVRNTSNYTSNDFTSPIYFTYSNTDDLKTYSYDLINHINFMNVTSSSLPQNILYNLLSSSCQINLPTYADNKTYSCVIPSIDTTGCYYLGNDVSGNMELFPNDYTICGYNSTWFAYVFNTTNTYQSRIGSCNIVIDGRFNDYNVNAYKNKNAYSTCYFFNNNTNLTMNRMYCDMEIACAINITTSEFFPILCDHDYLYYNVTFISQSQFNYTSSQVCINGCFNFTSCNSNPYNPFPPSNKNNTDVTNGVKNVFVKNFMSMMFGSADGLMIFLFMLLNVFVTKYADEDIISFLMCCISSVISVLDLIVNVNIIPMWISLLMWIAYYEFVYKRDNISFQTQFNVNKIKSDIGGGKK